MRRERNGKKRMFSFCFRSKENKTANCGILNIFFHRCHSHWAI